MGELEGSAPPGAAQRVFDLDAIVHDNEQWRATFDVGALQVRPIKQAVILTCMDSRYPAAAIIGFKLGEAHTIRNAGGRATDDAVRSLIISAHALGTRACIVIHHTDCGLFGQTNDNLRQRVKSATGQSAAHIDFLPFADLEESVRDDVEQIRACRFLPEGYEVVGMIYDVRTGLVIPVDTPHQGA
jgi:carbonic anhydrase